LQERLSTAAVSNVYWVPLAHLRHSHTATDTNPEGSKTLEKGVQNKQTGTAGRAGADREKINAVARRAQIVHPKATGMAAKAEAGANLTGI
jgi:hypothetical protein